jgi:molecular chaperone GrpE
MSQQTPWDDNDVETGEQQQPDPAQQQDAHQPAAGEVDVQKLQEERDSLFDRLARTQAEFRNAQRRLEQDKEQAIQYANSSLIKTLIPVIDNLDRAVSVDPAKTEPAAILKGMQIVLDQLANVLANQGVEVVNPAPGTPFDPNRHEALMHQPSDKYTDPTVVMSLQKGYVMHGRTLRPAGVAVSP